MPRCLKPTTGAAACCTEPHGVARQEMTTEAEAEAEAETCATTVCYDETEMVEGSQPSQGTPPPPHTLRPPERDVVYTDTCVAVGGDETETVTIAASQAPPPAPHQVNLALTLARAAIVRNRGQGNNNVRVFLPNWAASRVYSASPCVAMRRCWPRPRLPCFSPTGSTTMIPKVCVSTLSSSSSRAQGCWEAFCGNGLGSASAGFRKGRKGL
jgi:hypothetical protein